MNRENKIFYGRMSFYITGTIAFVINSINVGWCQI